MNAADNLLTEVDGGIGIVTLNRATRHNTFDGATIGALSAALTAMDADPAVRVVVIGSVGKAFCGGMDLAWLNRTAADGAESQQEDARALGEMLRRIAHCSKPVIARVHGPAFGGGVGLVAACDIAIATFDAQFGLSEVKLGLIPAMIAPHVLAAIGERYARRYMLTAERFSAAEAYRIGLVHEIVADEAALDEAVGDIVVAVLKAAPGAIAECKSLIRAIVPRPPTDELIADGAQRHVRVRGADEAREGMAAFLAKRKPGWAGST